jgi:hypothetical protein
VSTSNARTSPANLQGRTLKGSAYIYVTSAGARSVRFYLDDTARAKTPRTDSSSPFDFAGTATNGRANPYVTTALSVGGHSMTVAVTNGGLTRVVTVTFWVVR